MSLILKGATYAFALGRIKGVGPRLVVKILREFPDPDGLLHASQGEISAKLGREFAYGLDASLTREWHNLWRMAEETMQCHVDKEIFPISLVDEPYPPLLKLIQDPPAILFTRGQKALLKKTDAVAIVGTRAPTERGRQIAYKIAQSFAQHGYMIVSGLAKGIDAMAHLAALDSQAPTVAVLGTSLDKIYPAENRSLAERIVEASGILVSEVAIGRSSFRSAFVQRDRIQSGLSLAVIPIQTNVEGGTMHTVRFAEEQQRLIFCPKPLDADLGLKQSAGILELIRSGRARSFTGDDYLMIFNDLSKHKERRLSLNPEARLIHKRIEDKVVQSTLALDTTSGYSDLPPELQRFWSAGTSSIPREIRSVITAGWAKMSDSQRASLIESLATKPDALERILIANQEAVKVLLL